MGLFQCTCKCLGTIAGVLASVVIGVVTAFLHITGVVTVTPVFLWVVLGIAVGYLGILVGSTALTQCTESCRCVRSAISTTLVGILGSILFSVVLLAIGVVATSVLSAILSGVLLFFLSLIVIGSASLVHYRTDSE